MLQQIFKPFSVPRASLSLIAAAVLLWAAVPFAPVQAQEEKEAGAVEEAGAGTGAPEKEILPFDNLAVIMAVDISGSMSYTDPQRLRETAAAIFIDLLGEEDYLGIVTFDDRAEVMAPLKPVGGPAARAELMNRLSPALEPRGDTDFVAALELARRQFAEAEIGEKVPVVLLLTDGEPDPYPGSRDDEAFMAEYMESLREQVDLLAGEGILVYTVGFSPEIDPEVIRRIALETRGRYYILSEPSELLVTFYRALEALKDRSSFLEETVDLGAGSARTFNFEVGEHIRQVNLVLVSDEAAGEDAGGLQVEVRPPRGSGSQIEELILGGRGNYQTVILSRPKEEHYGLWEVIAWGRGTVQALGNADLYVEAVLMDPDPGSHYPLDEPLEIRVEVITREERYAGTDFRVELEVTGPQDPGPLEVPLHREGSSFRGAYEYVDRPGDYRFDWRLLRGDEEIYSDKALITAGSLPGLATDFWADREGFRLAEELIVSASLTVGGERAREGPHLQVDGMIMALEYRDGARVELELFDSGEREHGNSRAGDGIYSNRLLFDREGGGEAVLTATGRYREANFVLKKRIAFSVSPPGELAVRLLPADLWSRPGGRLEVPLKVENASPFTQTIRFSSPAEKINLLSDRVVIPPGDAGTYTLEMAVSETVETGLLPVTLSLEAEDGMALVDPAELTLEIEILSGWAAFSRRASGPALVLGTALGAILLAVGLFFGGGMLLYRFYLLPRLAVKGRLSYRQAGAKANPGRISEMELDLGQAGKEKLIISFGRAKKESNFSMEGSGSEYDLVVENRWHDRLPPYRRGWKALFRRRLAVETTISCTPPGIIKADERICSSRELHDGDTFESGGYIFRYRAGFAGSTGAKDKGVNILNGKM